MLLEPLPPVLSVLVSEHTTDGRAPPPFAGMKRSSPGSYGSRTRRDDDLARSVNPEYGIEPSTDAVTKLACPRGATAAGQAGIELV
jgi:hypothetical protein